MIKFSSSEQTICNMQHETCNIQHTTYNIRALSEHVVDGGEERAVRVLVSK